MNSRDYLMFAMGVVFAMLMVVVSNYRPASAQSYLVATLGSYHFDREKKYKEGLDNFGLGLEHRFSDDWAISAGYYRNSFDRHTNYLLAAYTPLQYSGWRLGGVVGGVTGYTDGVAPWITGIATRDFGSIGINVVFSVAGAALQVKLRIGR